MRWSPKNGALYRESTPLTITPCMMPLALAIAPRRVYVDLRAGARVEISESKEGVSRIGSGDCAPRESVRSMCPEMPDSLLFIWTLNPPMMAMVIIMVMMLRDTAIVATRIMMLGSWFVGACALRFAMKYSRFTLKKV